MSTPSPSEFLTFYRRVTLSSSLRYATASTRSPTHRPIQATYLRQFSLSSRSFQQTSKGQKEHAAKKVSQGDTHDVQSSNAKGGMDANKSGTGGNATERKDSAGGMSKAKKEFPEAPDPAIGMQDERGGRGG